MSSDISKDATDAAVKWSLDKIERTVSDFVYKFKNKQLLFLQDKEDITKINSIEKSSENQTIKLYIKDKELLLLARLGFFLRSSEKDYKKVEKTRERIVNKFTVSGLHIACFFQNGLFLIYFKDIIESGNNNEAITSQIEHIITKIEDISLFIKKDDNIETCVDIVKIRIYATSSCSYIISSYNIDAMKKCELIKNKLSKLIGKRLQITEYREEKRLIYIFKLKTVIMQ